MTVKNFGVFTPAQHNGFDFGGVLSGTFDAKGDAVIFAQAAARLGRESRVYEINGKGEKKSHVFTAFVPGFTGNQLNGADIIERRGGVTFVVIPKHLRENCGRCDCPNCKGNIGEWDALAVPDKGHAYQVHYGDK